MTEEIVLKLEGISKSFPGVKALDNVSLEIKKGEIHAIVGENGAGKSTLMNIISGACQKDSGRIIFKNIEVIMYDPRRIMEMGIATIYQEFNLASCLDVVSNIFMGREVRRKYGFVNRKKMIEETNRVLLNLDMQLEPTARIRDLNISQQQMIEIARAILMNAEIIIMDEPNSSLSEHETEFLFNIIRKLKNQGKSIIYVSHRLSEVFEIADRITVLRDGKNMGTLIKEDASIEKIINIMIGRKITDMFQKKGKEKGSTILEVRGLSKKNKFNDISFYVNKGEVVGLTGLVGAGKTEVAEVLFGIEKADSGDLYFEGKLVKISSPIDSINLGLGLIPEDRRDEGLILPMDVKENININIFNRISQLGFVKRSIMKKRSDIYINKLNIKTPSLEQKVLNLSGGNQQKVVIAKWLNTESKMLILDEPTRGIDVNAKSEIYKIINNLANEGVGILFISSDINEILGMCDKILVMYKGKIVVEFNRDNATEEKLLTYAMGGKN